MPRVMELHTPLGDTTLLFHSMNAVEALGRPFEYSIVALSEKADIDPDKLLGHNVTVDLALPNDAVRHFDGYVTRFGLMGMDGRYYRYEIAARPWLWLLTRTSDCRIFQNMKVPDIIKAIFNKYPIAAFEARLSADYRVWEYCVQYRETDFNFVSRLMEQEGIFYYFKHSKGKHTLVLADSYSAVQSFPGYGSVPFIPLERNTKLEKEHINEWTVTREIQPGAMMLDEYDFKKPSVELKVSAKQSRSHAEASHEYFDYPGEYVTAGEGDHYVKSRLEELQAQHELAQGNTGALGLSCGYLFKLTGHGRSEQNREYLVTSAHTQFQYNGYESTEGEGSSYQCRFIALNSKTPFRSARSTPKPTVQGPQTAVVVGPAGEEIYVDEYGRIKVQFHWDRYAKKDENASCWIRVSQPWAGKQWGGVANPRIGQEVIVDFLEGDPDQPIVTGRVYNQEQMPPYGLPANKTQTGIKSRSSPGGGAANFNEIRFEDKTGAEQVFLHAEKNQDIEVEHDETHWVGHDRKKTIDNDETTHVKHDRTETVDNNETITIHQNRTETVDKDETITINGARTETVAKDETITINGGRTETVAKDESITINGARTETVAKDESITINGGRTENVSKDESITIGGGRSENVSKDESITIGGGRSENVSKDESITIGGGRTVSVGKDDNQSIGKNLVINAGDSVTITTGSASITMKKDGTITVKGKDITIDGSGKMNVKASSDVVIKGSKVGLN